MKSNSFESIFKATILLGAVQIVLLISNILKNKFAALWIGPEGFGLITFYTTILMTIVLIGSFRLETSMMSPLTIAFDNNDDSVIKDTLDTFKVLAIFASLSTIVFSLILSNFYNDSENDISQLWILGIAVFFRIMNIANNTILQASKKLKKLSTSNMIFSIISVLFALIVYYFMGINGILLVIVFSSILSYSISNYFIPSYNSFFSINLKGVIIMIKDNFKLSSVLVINSFSGKLVLVLIQSYILAVGSIEDLGLYAAGFAMVEVNVNLIYNALASFYFPNLSSAINSRKNSNRLIKENAEIILIIIGIVSLVLLHFLPFLISLLYTKDFLAVIPMTQWVLLALPLKSITWLLGYVFLAKSDYKIAFIFDNLINAIYISSYILSFKFFYLEGVGFANLVMFILSSSISVIIIYKKYKISIGFKAYYILFVSLALSLATILFNRMNYCIVVTYLNYIIFLAGIFYYLFELNKRIKISSIINKYIR